jgi:hypothetical protein
MAGPCEHVEEIRDDRPPVEDPVCEECAPELRARRLLRLEFRHGVRVVGRCRR